MKVLSSCGPRKLHIMVDGTASYLIAQRWEEKETGREGQMRTISEEEWGKKIWGVHDSLIKRCGEERGERGGVAEKMCGEKRRQRDAGRDQYRRVIISSLWGSGGTAPSDIRDQSLRVHECWFTFLLLSMSFRKRKRLGLSCCMQAASKCLMHVWWVMRWVDSGLLRQLSFDLNRCKWVQTLLKLNPLKRVRPTHTYILFKWLKRLWNGCLQTVYIERTVVLPLC